MEVMEEKSTTQVIFICSPTRSFSFFSSFTSTIPWRSTVRSARMLFFFPFGHKSYRVLAKSAGLRLHSDERNVSVEELMGKCCMGKCFSSGREKRKKKYCSTLFSVHFLLTTRLGLALTSRWFASFSFASIFFFFCS